MITGSNGLLGQKLLHRLIEDDNIGEPYISTIGDISNNIQTYLHPNITNNINELFTANISTPTTTIPTANTTTMSANNISTNDIPIDINSLLHNLRSLSQTTIYDPSNSTLNSRYNFLEEYIENSYLESNEIQRTLYESLSYNNLQPNTTQENSHPSQEAQRQQEESSEEEKSSEEEEISTEPSGPKINKGKTIRTISQKDGIKKVTKTKDGIQIHYYEEDDGEEREIPEIKYEELDKDKTKESKPFFRPEPK